ncbi:ABC transporter permease subunit [Paenibacillus sp. LMG 31458]|uniref:ABC transporter permease subunit n=1 Tax=Paenibacillus phytorum TaxID=2654977 RepID=A0ABX1YAL0_9BACL|nr:sugar ABC transporter permease [Paenibacillus phytorum]NOU76864.1 ABC transporter permease subunit [Paenibacillus phytorum]
MSFRKIDFTAYLCLLPALIGSLAFTVYPVFYVLYLSLHQVDLLSGTSTFVSIDNYVRLFGSEDFLQMLGNTFIYMTFTVVISCSLSLVLAVMLDRPGWFHSFIQTAVFSPHIIPLVSVSLLWQWLMDKDAGLLNMGLQSLGLPKLLWIDSPDTALMSLILVAIWKSLGFNIILIIAGMRSIPRETLEAARLENGGPFIMFYKIIIPQLSPTIFFMLTVNIIGSFQVFDSVKVMTGGGPGNSSNVLVHWIYQTGFEFYRFGDASAGAVVLFVLVSTITFLNFGILHSKVHYQ